jgi:hypothetical protein
MFGARDSDGDRIEKRGAQRGVMLDAEFVELEHQGNRPVLSTR